MQKQIYHILSFCNSICGGIGDQAQSLYTTDEAAVLSALGREGTIVYTYPQREQIVKAEVDFICQSQN